MKHISLVCSILSQILWYKLNNTRLPMASLTSDELYYSKVILFQTMDNKAPFVLNPHQFFRYLIFSNSSVSKHSSSYISIYFQLRDQYVKSQPKNMFLLQQE